MATLESRIETATTKLLAEAGISGKAALIGGSGA
jgi:hypothetical protein